MYVRPTFNGAACERFQVFGCRLRHASTERTYAFIRAFVFILRCVLCSSAYTRVLHCVVVFMFISCTLCLLVAASGFKATTVMDEIWGYLLGDILIFLVLRGERKMFVECVVVRIFSGF